MTSTPLQIYQQYFIPENLAEHMLFTGAISYLICHNWQDLLQNQINPDLVVKTMLFHDMGNLIKFEISQGRNFQAKTLPLNYFAHYSPADWQAQQKTMIKKYGKDTDLANYKILKELGLDQSAIYLKDHSFERLAELVLEKDNWQEKLILYCDLRFTPDGLASVEQRVADLRLRYQHRDDTWKDSTIYAQRVANSLKLEEQLDQCTLINLKQITKAQVVEQALQLLHSSI